MNALIDDSLLMTPDHSDRHREAIRGVLIGGAVGDALGLPMEGLSVRRQKKLFPAPLRHRFIGCRGMVSDDTEHAFMVAKSLLERPVDSVTFQRGLARRLKWWLAALPAGVGLGTLRAILKLWVGVSPQRSGVWSAGNGPAMRSAIIGVVLANDPERRREFVRASSELTHRDPRAIAAAFAVAETAAWMAGASDDTGPLFQGLRQIDSGPGWSELVATMRAAFDGDEPVAKFARRVGATTGVSGYAWKSVPVAIYAALRHRTDFSTALEGAIGCGGDTDTVGAITGALVGARVGVRSMPVAWREGIVDFPLSVALLDSVAARLAGEEGDHAVPARVRYYWPFVPLRNVVFLAAVLVHGMRRLLPPF